MKNLHGHAAVREESLPIDATGLLSRGRQGEAKTLKSEELPAIGNLYRKLRRTAFCADSLYHPAVGALHMFGESDEGALFCVSGMGTRKE